MKTILFQKNSTVSDDCCLAQGNGTVRDKKYATLGTSKAYDCRCFPPANSTFRVDYYFPRGNSAAPDDNYSTLKTNTAHD